VARPIQIQSKALSLSFILLGFDVAMLRRVEIYDVHVVLVKDRLSPLSEPLPMECIPLLKLSLSMQLLHLLMSCPIRGHCALDAENSEAGVELKPQLDS
jgi:hypothetical protein